MFRFFKLLSCLLFLMGLLIVGFSGNTIEASEGVTKLIAIKSDSPNIDRIQDDLAEVFIDKIPQLELLHEVSPARAHHLIASDKNYCSFLITQNPEVMEKYQWVLVMAKTRILLLERIQRDGLQDDPVAAVSLGSQLEKYADYQTDLIHIIRTRDNIVQMLRKNRLQYWIEYEPVAEDIIRLNPDLPLQIKYSVGMKKSWLACSKAVGTEMISRLRAIWTDERKRGTIKPLYAKNRTLKQYP